MLGCKPYVLIILDGWGIGKNEPGNAVYLARTPYLNKLMITYPTTQLKCSGASVGLPKGVMGNSEVGHLNIGAGRIVYQDLLRINRSIDDGSFYKNKCLNDMLNRVIVSGASLHLLGLLSDGGVHSHIDHLYALLNAAKEKNITNVFVHPILDGRDTSPYKGFDYLKELQSYLKKNNIGKISTVCGRYYAMDRDKRWDRVKIAYELYTEGKGKVVDDLIDGVKEEYSNGHGDEFIKPMIHKDIIKNGDGLICNKDVLIFFNFRSDRARELSCVFIEDGFNSFKREIFLDLSGYLTMTNYDPKLKIPSIMSSLNISNSLGEIFSNEGFTQLRIAETEKYAHVTYFLNGGKEDPFLNEDRCLIPSPRDVDTYDKKPEMSAYLITDKVLKYIKYDEYDFIVINFANMDMVGHTGVLNAAIEACEIVDRCVSRIIVEITKKDGTVIVTSDHGNSEKMLDISGNPFTAHTKNKVPMILVNKNIKNKILLPGSLKDIAPTLLNLADIKTPKLMTGTSLIHYKT